MPFQQLSFNHIYNRCPMSQVTENPKSSAMHLACSWLTQSRERWLNQLRKWLMRNHSAGTVEGHRKVLSGFLKPDSLGLIHIILNNKREANSEPRVNRVETNTHNCKSRLQRMCWFTWGTHCCRVRVHMTGIFSPAATSIVSSLRNGKQKRHLRWKGLLLLPWNKQNNFLKSNFGYWLVIADLFIFAHL